MVIGITGGVGCGKSFVLKLFEKEFGAYLLEADSIAHILMEPGRSCYIEIVDFFGTEILKEDQTIDRKKLSDIVFSDHAKLKTLNSILHPMIYEYILGEIDNSRLENPARIVVIEAALLLEAGYDKICDEVWYIYADEAIRRERLRTNRGYSDKKITALMENQKSDLEFRNECQRVIENNGTENDVREQMRKILKIYKME